MAGLCLPEWQNVLNTLFKSLAKSVKKWLKKFTKEFIFSKVAGLRLTNLWKIHSFLIIIQGIRLDYKQFLIAFKQLFSEKYLTDSERHLRD